MILFFKYSLSLSIGAIHIAMAHLLFSSAKILIKFYWFFTEFGNGSSKTVQEPDGETASTLMTANENLNALSGKALSLFSL
jgi:hypothetical protein